MTYNRSVSLEEILNLYGRTHQGKEGRARISAAHQYAAAKHEGMIRGTGEPYVCHPMRAARMTAEWGFECDVIIAALLHDVVEDCHVPLSEIAETFGPDIARLVDAVTDLSDQAAEGRAMTKRQKDRASDVWLQKKMNSKALYVKIADRIDNLNTLDGVPEDKRIPKTQHTREIIIPMAEKAQAWRFVDVLEELCFKAEHEKMYDSLSRKLEKLLQENSRTYGRVLDTLSAVFDPKVNRETTELDDYHRFLCRFIPEKRSLNSIFRQLCPQIENIREDWFPLITKDTVALHNLTLLVDDRLQQKDSNIKPKDVFVTYYEKSLSQKGFYLVNYCQTTHKDTHYFLLTDELFNLYRVFVKTESEYRRYLFGSIIDSAFSMPNVNEYEPRESYNEQIKVFKRNGAAMDIDKGATALDFAFTIHTDLGYHFSYALVNESKAKQPPSYRLNEGDTVTVVDGPNVRPTLSWFKYAKTSLTVNKLIQYFKNPENLQFALNKEIERKEKNERK